MSILIRNNKRRQNIFFRLEISNTMKDVKMSLNSTINLSIIKSPFLAGKHYIVQMFWLLENLLVLYFLPFRNMTVRIALGISSRPPWRVTQQNTPLNTKRKKANEWMLVEAPGSRGWELTFPQMLARDNISSSGQQKRLAPSLHICSRHHVLTWNAPTWQQSSLSHYS